MDRPKDEACSHPICIQKIAITTFGPDVRAALCRSCIGAHARCRIQRLWEVVSRKLDAGSDTVACALHSQQAVLDQQCAQNHSAAWNRLQPCRGRIVVLAAGGMVGLG
jgi:hypothetical protein